MKLRFSRLARNDLMSIGEWIAKDNPSQAAEYVFEIQAACQRLTEFPQSGEKVGRYEKLSARRKVVSSHVILYTIKEETIFVARVIHAAQDYLRFLD